MPRLKKQDDTINTLSALSQQERTRIKKMYESRSRNLMKKAHELAVLTQSKVHVYMSVPGTSRQFKVFLSDLNDEDRISTSNLSDEQVYDRILGPNDFFTVQELKALETERQKESETIQSYSRKPGDNYKESGLGENSESIPFRTSEASLGCLVEVKGAYNHLEAGSSCSVSSLSKNESNQATTTTLQAHKFPPPLDLDFRNCINSAAETQVMLKHDSYDSDNSESNINFDTE